MLRECHCQDSRRQGQAATNESLAQQLPRSRQPPRNGGDGTAQVPGRGAISLTFEITEEKGEAIHLRQTSDLLIEERLQVAPGDGGDEIFLSRFTHGLLM